MKTPHKNAALIKAWADGALHFGGVAMKKPHKHAEFIKAWADGYPIEFRFNEVHRWEECAPCPSWSTEAMYRIKPEPKPDVITYATLEIGLGNIYICPRMADKGNLKLTFDGETGKLKSAEVIA